jgi:hypothetical protein
MKIKMLAKVSDGAWFYFHRILGVLLLLCAPKRRRIYVMGDSHALIFYGRLGVMCRHLGPITLNRFGREGEAKVLFDVAFSWPRRLRWLPFPNPTAVSTVILSFGEIDVRAHVDRISREQHVSHSEIIGGLADSAIRGILELRDVTDAQLILLSPPPPVKNFLDEKFPTGGSFEERVRWMNELKYLLSARISELESKSVFFCDISQRFIMADGALDPKFSDGTVHYTREVGDKMIELILTL